MASPDETVSEFYPKYFPTIRAHKHTCVGLGIEAIKRLKTLENDFPGIASSMMLVSCDENIPDLDYYMTASPGPQGILVETEKYHVTVCIHVKIAGRPGVFLSDLGYHVVRVITVMMDRCYPHTGWFTQSDDSHSRKEYNYEFNSRNANYVEWQQKDTRGTSVREYLALIYVAKPYLTSVNVTEKSNLVWPGRSLLGRDAKGHLTAGIYFPVIEKDQQFTMLFGSNNGTQRKKINFQSFLELQKIPDDLVDEVELCNEQLRMGDGELLTMLKKLATIMADEDFIAGVLGIKRKLDQLVAGE